MKQKVLSFVYVLMVLLSSCVKTASSLEAYRPSPFRSTEAGAALTDRISNFFVSRGISGANLNPVVLIPGFIGSSLEQKLVNRDTEHWWCRKNHDWTNTWIHLSGFLPSVIDCWLSNFHPVCDMTAQTCFEANGIHTRPIGDFNIGDTRAVEYLDPNFKWMTGYMYQFIEALDKMGAKRKDKVYAVPYDFRFSARFLQDELHPRIQKIVEMAYARHGQKAYLISHSNGGLVGSYFLNSMTQEWKDKHIKEFIAVAPPFSGSTRSLVDIAVGNTYHIPTLTTDKAKQLVSTWTAPTSLLPRDFSYTDIIGHLDGEQFNAKNLSHFFNATDSPSHAEFMSWDLDLVDVKKPPSVPLTVIGTTDIKMPRSFEFSRNRGSLAWTVAEFGTGDGTVEVCSMIDILKYWKDHQSHPLKFLPYVGVDHAEYFMHADFVQFLIGYLVR